MAKQAIMGKLEKMTIIGYKDSGCSSPTGKRFTAMVNPMSYGKNQGVRFSDDKVIEGGNAPSYLGYDDGKLNLKFVLDTTGVIPGTGLTDLPNLIKQLENTVYTYVGTTHEPPYIKVTWGTLSYSGRAKNLKVEYKLFSPAGKPLRVEVSLDVIAAIPVKTQELEKKKSSPDLTHIITVKAGDTLPGLCMEVYNSTAYCIEVARINGLTGFREIAPGTRLLFPPLANA